MTIAYLRGRMGIGLLVAALVALAAPGAAMAVDYTVNTDAGLRPDRHVRPGSGTARCARRSPPRRPSGPGHPAGRATTASLQGELVLSDRHDRRRRRAHDVHRRAQQQPRARAIGRRGHRTTISRRDDHATATASARRRPAAPAAASRRRRRAPEPRSTATSVDNTASAGGGIAITGSAVDDRLDGLRQRGGRRASRQRRRHRRRAGTAVGIAQLDGERERRALNRRRAERQGGDHRRWCELADAQQRDDRREPGRQRRRPLPGASIAGSRRDEHDPQHDHRRQHGWRVRRPRPTIDA